MIPRHRLLEPTQAYSSANTRPSPRSVLGLREYKSTSIPQFGGCVHEYLEMVLPPNPVLLVIPLSLLACTKHYPLTLIQIQQPLHFPKSPFRDAYTLLKNTRSYFSIPSSHLDGFNFRPRYAATGTGAYFSNAAFSITVLHRRHWTRTRSGTRGRQ